MNNYQPILLKFYRRECLRKRMRKDVGHPKPKPKQKSGVFKCCSNGFILQGEKIRSELFAANFLISTSAHIFPAFAAKNSLRTKKFVSCKSGFSIDRGCAPEHPFLLLERVHIEKFTKMASRVK